MIRQFRKLIVKTTEYLNDTSVNMNDRAFVVFSTTVLVALFAAIPCGLIMHEPLSATLSTLAGAVFFTAYVAWAIIKDRLEQAKIFISIVLVFVFLPVMFFTNGGVYGGTPIWLLLGTIYIALILNGRLKIFMLIMDVIVLTGCWIVGYTHPEYIAEYSRAGNYFDSMAGIIIVSGIIYTLISFQNNLSRREEKDKSLQRLFSQTATALVNAIDAKDKYTHGHSSRVAEYSRKIAQEAGLSERECEDVYYTALLHDVGKIGIPENIINKEGKLTDEEYAIIKTHPELGAQILQSISEIPFISIGAHHHHERYDGKGYPSNLKGTDIPEYARIISVADAYDAMTSRRSYRDPIPQQQVREEFVKGAGTQFDPDFARIMIHLIDIDSEYDMKEREEIRELAGKNELVVGTYRSEVSEGIYLSDTMTAINMKVSPEKKGKTPKPSILLFDALDGRVHVDENNIKELMYFEYGEIWFDGNTFTIGARKMETKTISGRCEEISEPDEYRVEAVRIRDHALIRIKGYEQTYEVIVALPDSARYAYISLTGEHCRISNVRMDKSEEKVPDDYIPRIAEEITYINVPAGDIPNIQIDGYRTNATEGIPVEDGMTMTFHTCSLPTSRLVWHCPYINIFGSDDGKVTGGNFHDYMLMRLDGECWEGDPGCDVTISLIRNDDFLGWDAWKKFNKEGYDCTVSFERHDNNITVRTENMGIILRNTATITDGNKDLYVSLTGDQCAITNIRCSTFGSDENAG